MFTCFLAAILAFCPTSNEIQENLHAVHATDEFPADGVLYAGFGKEVPDDIVPFRCTLHFALGELVRPIGNWMSWEQKTFAVVVPLKVLYPQLINLNCYDTFILGDLELTDDAVILVPEGLQCEKSPCQIVEYSSSLREAIDLLIASRGGWNVTMRDDNLDEDYAEALVDDVNINTQKFFKPLLEELPHLSCGLRWEEHHGQAWRFAVVEMLLFNPQGKERNDELKEHYKVLSETYLPTAFLSDKSKQQLEEKLELLKMSYSE